MFPWLSVAFNLNTFAYSCRPLDASVIQSNMKEIVFLYVCGNLLKKKINPQNSGNCATFNHKKRFVVWFARVPDQILNYLVFYESFL